MKKRHLLLVSRMLLALAIVGLISVNLSACQTVKGVGDDIHNLGQAGEDALNDD